VRTQIAKRIIDKGLGLSSLASAAESGAVEVDPVQLDGDLLAIIDAWPRLTPALRAKLLKLVRAARA
jgi:hypothetical protein